MRGAKCERPLGIATLHSTALAQIGENGGLDPKRPPNTRRIEKMSKIITEAMRKATPPLPGAVVRKEGTGQRRSLERGSHTRSKKNPGKRPGQG